MKVILYNFTWRNVVSSVLYDVRSEFCSKDKYHNWLYGKPWIDIDSSTSSTPILLLTDIRIQSVTPGDRLSQSSLVWRCGGASTPLSAGPHIHCSALYNCGQRKQWNIGFVDGLYFHLPPGGHSLHEALFAKCIIFAMLEVYFLLYCEQDSAPYKRHIKSGASRAQ